MNTFTISSRLNKNKVFILQKSELQKRLDPFFYIPELLELEKKVLAKKPKKLRDYIVSIASGATPKRAEEEKYYSDKENGIPFLRVQNLSQTGVLSLDNTKYINKETHNGMLKRSQVSEGDLLVKITGVGRMAVASVAPENFEGNINQHVCVIKTKDRKVSETLASFLNSDIGEKLASRRSTGGTRPALDYPALLSIPIIEDERILKIKKELIKQKTLNEQKAEKLLASIDAYLLKELDVELPKKQENTLKSRMFVVNYNEIETGNLSPNYILKSKRMPYNSKFKYHSLRDISIMYQPKTITKQDMIGYSEYKVFGANGHIGFYNKFNHLKSEVLITCRGATCGTINISEPKSWITGNAMVIKPINESIITKSFLFNVLNTFDLSIVITGSAQPQITREDLSKYKIPLPPKEKQDEIANHIKSIRDKSQALKDKTKELIENANKEMEKILLG